MKFHGTVRMWLDELERLPEYSTTLPTGHCNGKVWKARWDGWWMMCCFLERDSYSMYMRRYKIELLHGPRQGNERLRFKTSCHQGSSR